MYIFASSSHITQIFIVLIIFLYTKIWYYQSAVNAEFGSNSRKYLQRAIKICLKRMDHKRRCMIKYGKANYNTKGNVIEHFVLLYCRGLFVNHGSCICSVEIELKYTRQ